MRIRRRREGGALWIGRMLPLVCAAALSACFSEHASVSDLPDDGAALCGADSGPNVVQIRDYEFDPAELRVSAGTRVTWVNCGDDLHTSTADAGAWDSGLLSERGAYARTFDAAGRFDYGCEPHPFMRGAIVVHSRNSRGLFLHDDDMPE